MADCFMDNLFYTHRPTMVFSISVNFLLQVFRVNTLEFVVTAMYIYL